MESVCVWTINAKVCLNINFHSPNNQWIVTRFCHFTTNTRLHQFLAGAVYHILDIFIKCITTDSCRQLHFLKQRHVTHVLSPPSGCRFSPGKVLSPGVRLPPSRQRPSLHVGTR